jgi:hypothetical protein
MHSNFPNHIKYVCPVCGFLLDYPAKDFNICPSCGVEFDADTVEYSVSELRIAWMNRGMEWSSRVLARPKNYDAVEQLANLHISRVSSSTSPSTSQGSFKPSSAQKQDFGLGSSSGLTTGTLRLQHA